MRRITACGHGYLRAGLLAALLLLLPLGVASRAAAQSDGTTLMPYGDSGYSYEVVAHGGLPGFPTNYDSSGFTSGSAPFSSGPSGGCGYPQATSWPSNTDLLSIHSVDIPSGASGVSVSVGIDNDIVVYWDGIQIGSDTHENCASNDSFTYQVPQALSGPGPHQVAFRAIDRGGQTYFDATVRATAEACTGPSNLLGNPGFESSVVASSGFPAPLTLGNWLPFKNGGGVPQASTSLDHCGSSGGLVTGGYWVQDLAVPTDPSPPTGSFVPAKPFEFSFWFYPHSAHSQARLVTGWDRGLGHAANLISLGLTGKVGLGRFQSLALVSGRDAPGPNPVVSANQWHHFVALTSGPGAPVTLLMDGVPFGPAKLAGRVATDRATVLMGDTRGGSYPVAYDDVYLGPPSASPTAGITLTPRVNRCTIPCGMTLLITATNFDGTPAAGTDVAVTATPTAGAAQVRHLTTDASGHASFVMRSGLATADALVARFTDSVGKTWTSNTTSFFFIPHTNHVATGVLLTFDTAPPHPNAGDCTATAVSGTSDPFRAFSPSVTGLIVITAGHCAFGPGLSEDKNGNPVNPPPHRYNDFYFLPASEGCSYPQSSLAALEAFAQSPPRKCAPLGVWHGTLAEVPSAWQDQTDHAEDFAYIKVDPRPGSGATPIDATGGQAISFFADHTDGFRAFGYPAERDNRTDAGHTCTSKSVGTIKPGNDSFDEFVMPCPELQGGASGGPWTSLVSGGIGAVNDALNPAGLLGSRLLDDAESLFGQIDGSS